MTTEEEGGDVTIKTRSWEWFEEGVMKTSRLTRKWILLWSLQKDLGLLTPCLQPSETDFRLLTSLPTREHICIVLSHKKMCGNLLQQPLQINTTSLFLKRCFSNLSAFSPILATPCHLFFASLPKSFCICNDFYNIYEQQPITLRTKPKSLT